VTEVLVPLDESELSAEALPLASSLARASGARFDTIRGRVLTDSGLEVHTSIRVGPPAEEIIEEATNRSVWLIVMATHSRTGIDRARLGSVADDVVRRAPVPVLLVPRGWESEPLPLTAS